MGQASGAKADIPKFGDNLKRSVFIASLVFSLLVALIIGAGAYLAQVLPGSLSTLILALVGMLFTVVLLNLLARRWISPILRLARTARKISEGDLSASTVVDRKDELGLVAYVFNQMSMQLVDRKDELRVLAYSYNQAVQRLDETQNSSSGRTGQRALQMRVPAEIAQLSASSTNSSDFVTRAVRLIIERFDFLYASIYILDDTRSTAILLAEAARNSGSTSFVGANIRVGSKSLIGWVLEKNLPKLVDNTTEREYFQEIIFPGAKSQVAIPISLGETGFGALDIQSDQDNMFDENTLAVLEMIATQMAVGLQSIRTQPLSKGRDEDASIFDPEIKKIAQSESEAEVLALLSTTLGKCPYVSGIYTVEKNHIRVLSIIDPSSVSQQNSAAGISLPLMNIIPRLADRREVVIENISKPAEFETMLTFFSRRGCVSAVIFPIFEANELTKVIILGSRDSRQMAPNRIQPYAALFAVAAGSLSRFRILKNMIRAVTEFQALTQVSQALSVETDPHRLYSRLHEQILDVIGENVEFAVTIYNAAAGTIEVPYMSEGSAIQSLDPFPLGAGFTSQVLTSRNTLLINNNVLRRAQELGAKLVGEPARSWLGVPLFLSGEVIGVLVVQDLARENRFSEENVTLLETLAPQVAVSIRYTQLIAGMQSALHAYDQERFLLSVLLENIPDQIYFKDPLGKVIRSSRSFASAAGLLSPAAQGGSPSENSQPEPALSEQELAILASRTAEYGVVHENLSTDGSKTWAQRSLIPMLGPDQSVLGLLGIDHDITAMKLTEAGSQKNTQQLRIVAEVARDAAGSLDIDELLSRAVNLVRSRFGFYHASIFLIDATGTTMVLRESTGEAGRQLKLSNHRLGIGSRSIVGQASFRTEPMVSNRVMSDPSYYANPLLPNTRAELAVPLVIGDRVSGVLDVQSSQEDAFSPEDISILQLLADQLAVAVFNAQLFARAQKNLARHRLIHDITTSVAAKGSTDEVIVSTTQGLVAALPNHRIALFFKNDLDRLEVRASAGYEGVNLVSRAVSMGEGPVGAAAESLTPVLVKDFNSDPRFMPLGVNIRSQLAVPIQYSDRLIGVLSIESPQPGAFDENDQEIIATLGNSLGAVLSNAQLIGEIRRQVDRQRLIYEATSRIRRSVDIDQILKTSAEEICMALGANRARIEISPASDNVPSPAGVLSRDNGKEGPA